MLSPSSDFNGPTLSSASSTKYSNNGDYHIDSVGYAGSSSSSRYGTSAANMLQGDISVHVGHPTKPSGHENESPHLGVFKRVCVPFWHADDRRT